MTTNSINSNRPLAVPTPDASRTSAAKAPVAANAVTSQAPADGFAAQQVRSAPVELAPQRTTTPATSKPMVTPLDLDSAAAKTALAATEAAVPSMLPVLGGKETSFQVKDVTVDTLGMTHVRMDRLHNGLPVFGEQAIGHIGADGKVASVTGLVGQIPADLGTGKPKMSAAQAAKAIEKSFGLPAGTVTAADMTRTIAQGVDGKYKDSWVIEGFFANAKSSSALIDNETGKVQGWAADGGIIDQHAKDRAHAVAQAHADTVSPSPAGARKASGGETAPAGTGNDQTEFSGTVEIGGTAVGTDGKQQMIDSTRGSGIETTNNQNRVEDDKKPPVDFVDNNGAWGEKTDAKDQKTGIDAQYGAEMTYDFYKDVLGRDSIDAKGEKLLSTVNVRLEDGNGNLSPNAFWNGTQMTYGMGDGKDFGDMTTLDIAGHEISHGMSERTAGLIYRNESGGINESMSDIMGTGVEWYAAQKNPNVHFNFTIGEDAFTPGVSGDALRDMADPKSDGYSIDHYSLMKQYHKDDGVGAPGNDDNGGVHGSSGIMNNAFYLTANGGQNHTSGKTVDAGIGIESSLKIWGRALQFYMTPNSTFASTRDATIQAATDLFGAGSKEVKALQQSWSAVGVESTVS